ncbi:MAG: phosphoribosylglycinamide formyltransferase [Deltaproteobacteria bacterium]|nr:phosphoribosylglycinamide formyltransferase [Deltaproteobacteria bacterium]
MENKLVILASGRGSNFAAIANAIADGSIPNARIIALISNNADAGAIGIAKRLGIAVRIIHSKNFRQSGQFDRIGYEKELSAVLKELQPNWILLAGYMLILGKEIIQQWANKIVNIHPSLLPAFRGLRAQKQAIEAGVSKSGCTVHFVTEELDDGPIIAQNTVEVLGTDTEETLSQRLLPIEHHTYVEAVSKLCSRSCVIRNGCVEWLA